MQSTNYPNQGRFLFKTTIPGRVCIKKNGTQRKYSFKKRRTITCASDRYMEWENSAIFYLRQAGLYKPAIQCNIMVTFIFNFSTAKSLPDLSNCYGGPEDALQKSNIIKNDRQIKSHDGSRIKIGKNDSVEIEIYEYIGD